MADVLLQAEFAGSDAPDINDDSSAGWDVFSPWIDLVNDKFYVCLDASVGAAVWKRVDNLSASELEALNLAVSAHTHSIADIVDLGSWTGSSALTTVGAVFVGTWEADPVADSYIASAATWNAKLGPAPGSNNEVLTSDGAGGLVAESGLTFDDGLTIQATDNTEYFKGGGSNRQLTISSENFSGFDNLLHRFNIGSSLGTYCFDVSGSEKLRLTKDGYLGIGNTPNEKLQISGNLRFDQANPIIKYEETGGSQATSVRFPVVPPRTGSHNGQLGVHPSGSATESHILLRDSSTIASGNQLLNFGGGFSGAPAATWSFGATVNQQTNADSRPIGFIVSNIAAGRIQPLTVAITGTILAGTTTSPSANAGPSQLIFGDTGTLPTPGSNTCAYVGWDDGGGTVQPWVIDEAGTTQNLMAPTVLGITNDGNDRVLTSDGAGGLVAESGLTFDGSVLDVVSGEVQHANSKFTRHKNSSGTSGRLMGVDGANRMLIGDIDDVFGDIVLRTDSNDTRVTVQSGTGYVGVGVDPNYLLELGTGDLQLSSNAYLRFRNALTTSGRMFGVDGSDRMVFGDFDNQFSDFQFRTDANTTRMIIEEGTGNVAFGSSSPAYKVDVQSGHIALVYNNFIRWENKTPGTSGRLVGVDGGDRMLFGDIDDAFGDIVFRINSNDTTVTFADTGNILHGTTTSPTGTSGAVFVSADNGGLPTPGSNTACRGATDRSGTVTCFCVNENGDIIYIEKQSTYTQTYATATTTHAALTSATLTDSSGGTADTTVAAVSGSGDDATINNNFADLVAQVNALRVDLANAKQVINQMIDDWQNAGNFG